MDMRQAVTALADYTAGQWGLVTTAQANAVGVVNVTLQRLVEAGLLVRVRHGIYQLTASEESANLPEKSAWLALHPAVAGWDRPELDPDGGVVSHRSAALLHGLGELVAERIEIIVPRRRTTRDREVLLRQRQLSQDEVTLIDGLPVTTVERTVMDLLDDHVDASHIGQILHEANQRSLLDLEALAGKVGPFCRRYGVKGRDGQALIKHLLATVQPEPTPAEQALALAQLLNTLNTTNTRQFLSEAARAIGRPPISPAVAVNAAALNALTHSGGLHAQRNAIEAALGHAATPYRAFRALHDIGPQLQWATAETHQQREGQGEDQ